MPPWAVAAAIGCCARRALYRPKSTSWRTGSENRGRVGSDDRTLLPAITSLAVRKLSGLRKLWPLSGICGGAPACDDAQRSEEHTSELQSLMRISYAVFCLKKKQKRHTTQRSQLRTTITTAERAFMNNIQIHHTQ